jgi:A/G-specific adenine glycosylase
VSRRAPTPATANPAPSRAGLEAPRRALLAWWDRGHRDLPWRRTRDPWAVLVSEVMLQQTTVAAVVPYWERFLLRWPRPADLARAAEDELLSAWAGLGYYRRARHLQAAARAVSEAGGELPRGAAALRELPGVGDYTAAAVASIAQGEAVAAVDGNVERVLSRLFALPLDPRGRQGRLQLRAHADALLDAARPGDSNQALMELGATICRPTAPQCEPCPLRASCLALASGAPERFPVRPPRPAAVPMLRVALLARRGERVLLRRREVAPNAGFLELPDVEVPLRPGEELEAAARPTAESGRRLGVALERELLREHGLRVRAGLPRPAVRHGIMRWTIRIVPLPAEQLSGRIRAPLQWADVSAPDVPLTTATRRILAADDAEPADADAERPAAAARYPRASNARARKPR